MELNKYFDHTVLKAEASEEDVRKLCREAAEEKFFSVCVNSCYVPLAVSQLMGTEVKVAAVAGFPLGACSTDVKVFETEWCCQAGAAEIDMVLQIGALKEGRADVVREDIRAVVDAAAKHGAIVKVILETCLLTDEEIVLACQLSEEAGAAFVKTSTGFSTGGATAHHVALMKKAVGDRLEVKASGGIRDLAKVLDMIEAGADRIGASASVAIMEEYRKKPTL